MHDHAIPYRHQENEEFYCGPAIVQMLLAARGFERSQSELAQILGTDKTGTEAAKIEDFLISNAFSVVRKNAASLEDIETALASGAEVVVGYIETTDHKFAHYGLVADITKDDITLIDPLLDPHLKLTRVDFESRWHDDADNKYGERMMMAVSFPKDDHRS
jgi:hypothetical protein